MARYPGRAACSDAAGVAAGGGVCWPRDRNATQGMADTRDQSCARLDVNKVTARLKHAAGLVIGVPKESKPRPAASLHFCLGSPVFGRLACLIGPLVHKHMHIA